MMRVADAFCEELEAVSCRERCRGYFTLMISAPFPEHQERPTEADSDGVEGVADDREAHPQMLVRSRRNLQGHGRLEVHRGWPWNGEHCPAQKISNLVWLRPTPGRLSGGIPIVEIVQEDAQIPESNFLTRTTQSETPCG